MNKNMNDDIQPKQCFWGRWYLDRERTYQDVPTKPTLSLKIKGQRTACRVQGARGNGAMHNRVDQLTVRTQYAGAWFYDIYIYPLLLLYMNKPEK